MTPVNGGLRPTVQGKAQDRAHAVNTGALRAGVLQEGTPEQAGLDPESLRRVDAVVARALETGAFPGAVWLVARRGVVARWEAAGLAQAVPEQERRPMTRSTLFDLASITKPVVSLLVMRLVDEGWLRLDDPVAQFIEEMREGGRQAITLWHLLTHTSGIPGQIPLYRQVTNRAEMLRAVYRLPLAAPPGERVAYTSQGFMVVDELLRRLLGGPWEGALRQWIFEPMGLKSLRFFPLPLEDPAQRAVAAGAAATEACPWRGRVVVGEVHDENAAVMGGVAAHAGLFGTAWDVAAIGQMLLQGGFYGGRRILSGAAAALMVRNHTPHLNLSRALGWQGQDAHGSPGGDLMSGRSFGHTGFTGTAVWVDPQVELVAVLLTNRVHPSRQNEQIQRVRPLFFNAVRSAVQEDG